MPYCLKPDTRKRRPIVDAVVTLFLLILFFSCRNTDIEKQFQLLTKNQLQPSGITIIAPLPGTIFPPEFPAPLFSWNDMLNANGQWHIKLSMADGHELYRGTTEKPTWRPDSTIWQKIKWQSATGQISLTIVGSGNNIFSGKYTSAQSTFSFSNDSVGASIFFRAVPLPFSHAVKNVREIEWYSGKVDGGKPRKVLTNIPVCANCHSFSQSGNIAMDIDYANDKGSYIIANIEDTVQLTFDKIITWSDYKREDGGTTYGLLSQISPNGRYILSTVKDRSVFVAVDNLEYSQLFFPIKGIVAWYDKTTKTYHELPGASDKQYVQSNPNWSPNGDEVLFTRANRYLSSKIDNSETVLLKLEDAQEFITGGKEFKFDLCRVPFNNGKGGEAVAVSGASKNGKSNYFARYSPDGKWLVFCQADNFMLLQPDSKLYIMPTNGGTPRLMKCNTGNMNSWHSWSPNSRWLVFSSKAQGPYTQLYLTHIDENGNDSPPVLLENLLFDKKAANIPEFFPNEKSNIEKMLDQFSQNALYYNRLAALNIQEKKYKDALLNIEKAIKADSTFYEAYKNRVVVNLTLGQSGSKNDLRDKAILQKLIDKQIRLLPNDDALITKRGELKLLTGDTEGALQDGLRVIRANPNNYNGLDLVASAFQQTGQWAKALPYIQKMVELQPDNTHVSYNLANGYRNTGQLDKALALLNKIIDRYPNAAVYYLARANMLAAKGDIGSAKTDYDKAVQVDPKNYNGYRERAFFEKSCGNTESARKNLNKAIALLSNEIEQNPQDPSLQIQRAELTEQTGNPEKALQQYNDYLKNWPVNFSVLKNKAQIHQSRKEWPQAIDAYTTITDNFPDNAKAYFSRSLACQQSGNLSSAMEDLNTAIVLDSNEFTYFYFRGRIKKQLNDNKGYESDLKTSAVLLTRLKSKRELERIEQEMFAAIQKELNGIRK